MPMTSQQIAALEEPRQAAMIASVAPEVRPFAGGVMGFHEPGSWQNQACGVGLDGPVSDDAINTMVDFYTSRGVEPRVELSPFADETLIAGLASRQFVIREFESVLARELLAADALADALPFAWPEGLEITQVPNADAEQIARATELSLRGFFPDREIPKPMFEACRVTLSLDSTLVFMATIAGEAVAAGSVSVTGRVASLMGVSTRPEFRRRGIQLALIVTRLTAARDRGCVLATIGSRPGLPTERNAMRVGFTMAYTKVIVVRPGQGLVPSP